MTSASALSKVAMNGFENLCYLICITSFVHDSGIVLFDSLFSLFFFFSFLISFVWITLMCLQIISGPQWDCVFSVRNFTLM